MKSFIAALRSLVLPFGSTTGARIILDGVNGRIYVYNSTNDLIAILTPTTYTSGVTTVVAGFYTGILDGLASDQYIGLDPVGSPSLDIKLPQANGIDFSPGFVECINFGAPNYNPYLLLRSPLATTQVHGTDDAQIAAITRSTNGVSPSSIDLRADQIQAFAEINGGERYADLTSDLTLAANSTTFQDVLSISVTASAKYSYSVNLAYNENNVAKLKTQWTLPAGATLKNRNVFGFIGGTWSGQASVSGTLNVDGFGGDLFFWEQGTLVVGATAGTVKLQAAQQVANATAPIIRAGSSIRYKRQT
jgi:hypothetical protein